MCSGRNVSEELVIAVMMDLPMETTFSDLQEHMTETGVLDNHVVLLIKAVIKNYVKIRMHHLAKENNQARMKNERCRKHYSRLVVQKHQ